jgi:subtilisin family serine protease
MCLLDRIVTRALLLAALLGLAATTSLLAQEKPKLRKLDDLPRHSYKVTGKAIDLVKSDEAFAKFAKLVRTDVEADLAKFDIEDKTTLKRLHGLLLLLDVVQGRDEEALKRLKLVRDLEEKPAAKMAHGLSLEALLIARHGAKDPRDWSAIAPAFRAQLEAKLATLPYDIVGDTIKQEKARAEIFNENLLAGLVESLIEPTVAKKGEVSADLAEQITGLHALRVLLPLNKEMVGVYQAYLDKHKQSKPDIWAQRAIALPKDGNYTPVVIGIWDSGVDEALLASQFAGGIAYDLDSKRTRGLLLPLGDAKTRLPELYGYLKGFSDLQAGLDSPAATEYKKKISGLQAGEVKPHIEDMRLCSSYSHGTHVAGIALDGNPFARLVVARFTWDHHFIPKPYSIERAKAMAREWQETVDYFKEQHVRIVNMSWAYSLKEFESNLEVNGIGKDASERAALARKILDIVRAGLFDALKSAPDILFIAAAGNADNDVAFDEFIPSSFELPNLLVVGAVDQAGKPTGFTSSGKTVQVYANGFEVESSVPGGQRLKLSGTSMASPNVANLAGKILAAKPDLTPAEVIALIKKGVTPVPGAKESLLLIDPKRTLSLLKE